MSNTISGGISFSGLGSGIDTDSIIASLKSAQEIQSNRYKLSQAEYEYRISALEEVVTQMKDALSVLQKYNTANKMYNLSIESSESAVASATVKKAIPRKAPIRWMSKKQPRLPFIVTNRFLIPKMPLLIIRVRMKRSRIRIKE